MSKRFEKKLRKAYIDDAVSEIALLKNEGEDTTKALDTEFECEIQKKPKRLPLRLAVAIIVIISVIIACTIVAVAINDFRVDVSEEGECMFFDIYAPNAPATVENPRLPAVPKKFELTRKFVTDDKRHISYEWSDESGIVVSFRQSTIRGTAVVKGTSNHNLEMVAINGKEYYRIHDDGDDMYCLVWVTKNYFYYFGYDTSVFSHEEMVKMLNSILSQCE